MKQQEIKVTITVEREVEVTVSYLPGCKGHCDRFGAPEEPDTPAECDVIESVWKSESGRDVHFYLTAEEKEKAVNEALEEVANQYSDSMESKAEARAERRMEER